MENTLLTLFCLVDDFCRLFIPEWNKQMLASGLKKRNKPCRLDVSEIMTLFIHFHQMRFRDFKTYYNLYAKNQLASYFPGLVSYNRFIELLPSISVPLCLFLQTLTGEKTGIYFVDSTLLRVCHIKREKQHKVFKGLAEKSKSTIGWFFGFKLHVVINEQGKLIAFKVTAARTDDRKVVPDLVQGLMGKLFGDKGYISQELFDILFEQGLQLETRIKKNMKNKLMPLIDKLLLRKRAIIESVNDQLKNISQIEHTRHRSVFHFMVNILAALTAYALQPKKPSLHISDTHLAVITM